MVSFRPRKRGVARCRTSPLGGKIKEAAGTWPSAPPPVVLAILAVLAAPRQVEVMAFDYPGRDKLLKATKHTTTETLAPELLVRGGRVRKG